MMQAPADWQLPAGVNRALWDYLHNSTLAEGYDASLADSPLCRADWEFSLRHFRAGGRVVDLGCGTGRLAIPLAQRGYRVVGVDLSEPMLRQLTVKAQARGLAIPRLKANLADLRCLVDGSFDHAACLFSTLGMVMGTANRLQVVEHIHRLLRPGGMFILHVHNRWQNLWNGPGRRWLAGDAWRRLLGREGGDRVMPVHQGVAGLTLHLFSEGEIVRLLQQAGFQVREVRPLGWGPSGELSRPGWLRNLRAHGYLLAAERIG